MLPVAYALTGNQRAAGRLATRALARVARGWRRLDGDPAVHATRFLYHSYVDSPPADGPLDLAAFDEPAEALRRLRLAALRQLPPRQRVLLVLPYPEDRTDEEAADLLGADAGAIGGEIAAARDRLEALYASVTGHAGDDFDAEAELPLMLRELAEAAEPAPPATLASAALASVRRRRTRLVATVAAAVVLAVVAGVALSWPRESPPPDPTGLTVITSYRKGTSSYVLNSETGEYEF